MDYDKAIQKLNSWFKLENYAFISQLSDEQVYEQINFRDLSLDDAERLENKHDLEEDALYENCFESPDYYRWRSVIHGKPIIDFSHEYRTQKEIEDDEESTKALQAIQAAAEQNNQEYLDNNPDEKAFWLEFQRMTNHFHGLRVSGSNLVRGMQVTELKNIYEYFIEAGLIGKSHILNELDSELFFADINMVMKSRFINMYNNSYNNFFTAIDLASATDKEILDQMSDLLPMWRKELNIPEPKKRAVTPSLFKKVASYRIIPYLDVRIWSALFGIEFTHQQYADILFPDNPNRANADFIKQTVVRHTLKIQAILNRETDIEVLPFRGSRKKK
jgi:hypothetical protein